MTDTKEQVIKDFKNFKDSLYIDLKKSDSDLKIKFIERENYTFPINKNKILNLKTSIYCISVMEAPVLAGTKIGIIRFMCEDNILYEMDIVLEGNIEKLKWKDYFYKFLLDYKKYYI